MKITRSTWSSNWGERNWTFSWPIFYHNDDADQASYMAQERSHAKFKFVRHVKAKGELYKLTEESKARAGRLITGPWRSDTSSQGWYVFAEYGGGDIPPVPARYASIIQDCQVFTTNYGEDRRSNGWNLTEFRCIYWVRPDNTLALWALWVLTNGKQNTLSYYTYDPRYDIEAEPVKLADAYAFGIFRSRLPGEVYDRQGNLTPDLIDQMKACTVNQWEFLQDANLISQVIDVGKKLLTFDESDLLKSLSDLYLTYSFGASNTSRDYRELASSISTELKRYVLMADSRDTKVRSRSSSKLLWQGLEWEADYSLTAYLDAYDQGVMGLFNQLDRWGVYPDRAAIWEIVPWSFVVDWFVNVKENLRRRDALYWREYYNVHHSIRSVKLRTVRDFNKTNPNSLLAGMLSISLYERNVEQELPAPMVDLDFRVPRHFHQWVSGAALVIQRS